MHRTPDEIAREHGVAVGSIDYDDQRAAMSVLETLIAQAWDAGDYGYATLLTDALRAVEEAR